LLSTEGNQYGLDGKFQHAVFPKHALQFRTMHSAFRSIGTREMREVVRVAVRAMTMPVASTGSQFGHDEMAIQSPNTINATLEIVSTQ